MNHRKLLDPGKRERDRLFDETRAMLDDESCTGLDILGMFEKLRSAGVSAIAPTINLPREVKR